MTKVVCAVLSTFVLLNQTAAASKNNFGQLTPQQLAQISQQDQIDARIAADEFQWLYEKLMAENLRRDSPDETFKSFRVHLKDTYNKFPDPDLILKKNLNSYAQATEMTGSITYASIFKKPYRMTLNTINDVLNIEVRVHLKNPTAQDKIDFPAKVKMAEDLWNNGQVVRDFKYKFIFKIVGQAQQAHYSVNVQNETRGPYDTNWGRDWTGNTIAHEIGHMLGLGDEYQTISGEFDCLRASLMCSAWNGAHMKHHYYFVLRRFIKN